MPGSTPIDIELTRLPLPVLMNKEDFSLSGSNYHHVFHPMKSAELGIDPSTGEKFPFDDYRRVAGLAVRSSRGQKLPTWLHARYHTLFLGPPLPQTEEEQFKTVVLACAGIVPSQAIDLHTSGEYSIVDLSPLQHDFIRKHSFYEKAPKGREKSKRDRIGKFLASYTLEHSLSEIITETVVRQKVDELLKPNSNEQRIAAGRFILTQALDASVADIIPIHQEAKKANLVKHPQRRLIDVVSKFFIQDRYEDYYDTLADRLRILA